MALRQSPGSPENGAPKESEESAEAVAEAGKTSYAAMAKKIAAPPPPTLHSLADLRCPALAPICISSHRFSAPGRSQGAALPSPPTRTPSQLPPSVHPSIPCLHAPTPGFTLPPAPNERQSPMPNRRRRLPQRRPHHSPPRSITLLILRYPRFLGSRLQRGIPGENR